MQKKRTISFVVEDFEYEDILRYARIKGHGGQSPASAFSHYAVMQLMKKYPLKEAEIKKYVSDYGNNKDNSKAVQPNASMGREKREGK